MSFADTKVEMPEGLATNEAKVRGKYTNWLFPYFGIMYML